MLCPLADDPSVNYLINNNKAIYTVWMHHLTNSWCGADDMQLEAIASECPSLYGSVDSTARDWVAQQLVWNAIMADATLVDSSVV